MKGVTFVTRHYREGAFSVKNGWQRLGIELPVRWTPLRIAAGIAAVIAIGATAAMVTVRYFGEGRCGFSPDHCKRGFWPGYEMGGRCADNIVCR